MAEPQRQADPIVVAAVVSFRRPDALRRCLEGMSRQTLAPTHLYVGLRLDDAESHLIIDEWQSSLDVNVVDVARPGQVAALNAVLDAVRASGTPGSRGISSLIMAIVDDDAVPAKDWIENITRHFAEDDTLGALGGPDTVHRGNHPVTGEAKRVGQVSWWGRLTGNHHLMVSTPLDVMFLKGANMTFRVTALARFDERLRGAGAQVCNDLEASLSVYRRGWRVVFSPGVRVDHFPAARLDDDQRGQRSLSAQCAEQHNEVYALLMHQRLWKWPLILGYRLLMGYRHAPGLLRFPLHFRRHELRPEARRRFALARARIGALATRARAHSNVPTEEPRIRRHR